ncbi:MAG: response regulator [Deltaproteobacteria bacterium]|nr:response regulator [Deltaproteobacteria bacterium]
MVGKVSVTGKSTMGKVVRILVVDDELPICELMDEFLSSQGYQIMTATNGEEALAKFEDTGPDVVILDLRMPGMSGLEVLRSMRAQGGAAHIIMLSAYGDSPTVQEALRSGANYYVEKPMKFSQLVEILKDIENEAE